MTYTNLNSYETQESPSYTTDQDGVDILSCLFQEKHDLGFGHAPVEDFLSILARGSDPDCPRIKKLQKQFKMFRA